jgi:hypothetical protein
VFLWPWRLVVLFPCLPKYAIGAGVDVTKFTLFGNDFELGDAIESMLFFKAQAAI